MNAYQVIRHEREELREDRRGRVRSRRVLSWVVVKDGELYRDCPTRKEAVKEANRLNATIRRDDGRSVVTVVRYPRAKPRLQEGQ